MFAFFNRMLRDKYKTFIGYCLSTLALLEMYVALFPAIKSQAVQFDQMLRSFPPELFKAMNMDPATLSFSTLESYLSSEYMGFLWPILAIIFAISIANYISVNEIDKGTMETLVSLPVSRTKIFVERYLAGLLMMAGFAVVSLLGALPLVMMHGASFIFANFLTATIGSFLFLWAVYSLATLCSVIVSEKGRASMVSGGILTLMYVLFVISTLQDNLKNLRYVSFFNYFSGSDLLASNIYSQYSIPVLVGFSIVVAVVALLWFNKRDLSV